MNKNPYILEHGKLSNDILLNIAEILALRLPEGTERIIAAKWVKKFLACDPKDYKNNLSLFISSLTKQMLVEPFNQAPNGPQNQWQNFAQVYTNSDIVQAAMERLYKDGKTPPYKIEISQDLQEYVAFQEIPFFGAHFFYAFSPTEKIHEWQKFNQLKIPKKYVEALKLDVPPESPIKGRISRPGHRTMRKRGTRLAAPSLLIQKLKVLKKPQREAPIEEGEETSAEPQRKALISIPTDGPVSKIPPALQRRMAEAERQKHQRVVMTEQERKEAARRPRSKAATATPKPKVAYKAPKPSGSRRPATTAKDRPQWEGDAEEEPADKPQRKAPIVISSGGPKKAVPPALQRRMDEAERQRKDRVTLRDQESKKKGSRSRTPFTKRIQIADKKAPRKDSSGSSSSKSSLTAVKTPAEAAKSSNSLRVRILKRNASKSGVHMRDSIDLLRPVTPSQSDTDSGAQSASAREPEPAPMIIGPRNRMDHIMHVLSEAKNNQEIFLSESNEVVEEDPVNSEQQAEVQVNSIVENAEVVDGEFSDIMFQLKSLNQTSPKLAFAPDTLKKFRDIKARTQGVAASAIAIFVEPPQDEAVESAEQIVDLLNRSLEVAEEAVVNLSQVQTETAADQEAIQQLIDGNYDLINDVEAVIEPLKEAIVTNSPDLIHFTTEAAGFLNASIQQSNEHDDKLTDDLDGSVAVLEAVDIEDERNDKFEVVLEAARKVTSKVKRIARQFEGGSAANDSSILHFMGQDTVDDDEDLIDVNAVDLDFEGGAFNDEEFSEVSQTISRMAKERAKVDEAELIEREKQRFSSMFASMNNEDNLDDVTENFNGLLNESLELMDELENDLQDLLRSARYDEANAIQGVINRVKESRNVLEKSREEVNTQHGDTEADFEPDDDPYFSIIDSDDDPADCDEC